MHHHHRSSLRKPKSRCSRAVCRTYSSITSEEQMFARSVQDVFFDYDKYDIRPEAQQSLQQAAAFLKQHANLNFTIEGHCDERGSTEYNLALGDKRANSAKSALVQNGVNASRIRTI